MSLYGTEQHNSGVFSSGEPEGEEKDKQTNRIVLFDRVTLWINPNHLLTTVFGRRTKRSLESEGLLEGLIYLK